MDDYQSFVANKLQFIPPSGLPDPPASYYKQAVANLEAASNIGQAQMFESA